MTTSKRMFAKRALVAWLVYAFSFGPLATPAAYGASSDFSDVPLPSKKRPNPNLIFVVDDSGSMDSEISMDGNDGAAWYYTAGLTVGSGVVAGLADPGFFGLNSNDAQELGVPNFNRAGNANGTWKKYIYLFPNGVCGADCATRGYGDQQHDHFAVSPSQQFGAIRSPDWNKQYYNPTITYLPWKPYNDRNNNGGGACPSGTASGTGSTWLCTPGNATPTAARSHPIYGNETINLTVDQAPNMNAGFYFRLYDGMRILPGSRFRRCTGANDGQGCDGTWQTATALLCVGNSAAARNTCNLGGAGIPNTVVNGVANVWNTTGLINMAGYDHVEMAPTWFPARYFLSLTSTTVNIAQYSGFQIASAAGPRGEQMRMVEIRPSTPNYPKAATRTDCAGTTCTYAEEIQNFANWYQYYRKRHQSLNGAFGNAMDGVRGLRGAYFLFNNRFDVTMADYDSVDTGANGRRVLGNLYRVKGTGGTPTRRALEHAGQQFMRTNTGAPITHACQFNGAFVITDGFANDEMASTNYGNFDGQAPAGTKYPTTTDPTFDNYVYNQQYVTSGTPSRDPYRDNWSNTLADIAMYYYTTVLRTGVGFDRGRVPVDLADVAPDADRNVNLHMNTYGLVLGLRGEVFGNPAFATQNANPYTNNPNWNAVDPTTQLRSRTSIDELWHATINGRGAMLKADSPEETRNAVLDVVNAVVAKGGAAAAVSVSSANPVPGDNFVYESSFNSGAWAGDLVAYEINLTTGNIVRPSFWNPTAQQRLADRPWDGDAVNGIAPRYIATYNRTGSSPSGIPFREPSLPTWQKNALAGLTVGGQAVPVVDVVNWLRGDRTKETTTLRSRGPRKPVDGWENNIIPRNISVLGDIVNAEPVIVNPPSANFADAGYSTFKAANAARTRVVYQGANDGMVHAFRASDGHELWAYVPSFGFESSPGTTTPNPGFPDSTSAFLKRSLRNLADKEFFVHSFYVDSTPVTGDVDFNRIDTDGEGDFSGGSANWRTILVGGLGKGGRGWYALDVTSPAVGSDADVAAKVLWEFPNNNTSQSDKELVGYSFGRPIIAKTRAYGWVVIVASGYENGKETGGDGKGYLFFLDPRNGNVLKKMKTLDTQDGATDAELLDRPLGLAHINGLVLNGDVDRTVEAIYGGDLYGNVWKFDVSRDDEDDFTVSRVTTLLDASGVRQPVTVKPALALVRNKRVIYIGTGKYFGDTDIPDATDVTPNANAAQRQTLYAIKDDPAGAPSQPLNMRTDGVQQTLTRSGSTGTMSGNAVDWNTKAGWYVDLGGASGSGFFGERVITDPTIAGSTLAVTSNVPSGADACLPGGSSWFLQLDARTGSIVPGATAAAWSLGSQLASRVVVFRLPGSNGAGDFRGLIRGSGGDTFERRLSSPSGSLIGKRKAWREVIAR